MKVPVESFKACLARLFKVYFGFAAAHLFRDLGCGSSWVFSPSRDMQQEATTGRQGSQRQRERERSGERQHKRKTGQQIKHESDSERERERESEGKIDKVTNIPYIYIYTYTHNDL